MVLLANVEPLMIFHWNIYVRLALEKYDSKSDDKSVMTSNFAPLFSNKKNIVWDKHALQDFMTLYHGLPNYVEDHLSEFYVLIEVIVNFRIKRKNFKD
eukprot:TRINITY_DN6966_c0_g1_i1.p1 TRINITY_DN6966_c0_g1~~TRINITY_DN6966_c0_g1_i1.p1  ORF type:complete len:98 (-),score=9.96 TRINITY_DN6966_c0_g1_i1:194-487(-)